VAEIRESGGHAKNSRLRSWRATRQGPSGPEYRWLRARPHPTRTRRTAQVET
jgi:hypothetical protein